MRTWNTQEWEEVESSKFRTSIERLLPMGLVINSRDYIANYALGNLTGSALPPITCRQIGVKPELEIVVSLVIVLAGLAAVPYRYEGIVSCGAAAGTYNRQRPEDLSCPSSFPLTP